MIIDLPTNFVKTEAVPAEAQFPTNSRALPVCAAKVVASELSSIQSATQRAIKHLDGLDGKLEDGTILPLIALERSRRHDKDKLTVTVSCHLYVTDLASFVRRLQMGLDAQEEIFQGGVEVCFVRSCLSDDAEVWAEDSVVEPVALTFSVRFMQCRIAAPFRLSSIQITRSLEFDRCWFQRQCELYRLGLQTVVISNCLFERGVRIENCEAASSFAAVHTCFGDLVQLDAFSCNEMEWRDCTFQNTLRIDELDYEIYPRFHQCAFGGDLLVGSCFAAWGADFNDCAFASRSRLRGDFSVVRMRDIELAAIETDKPCPRHREDFRELRVRDGSSLAHAGWRVVRSIGRIEYLRRVSLIALIAIPVTAALWPAIRLAVTGYEMAGVRVAELLRSGNIDGAALPAVTDEQRQYFEDMSRFAGAWAEELEKWSAGWDVMPISLGAAFFAALAIVIAQSLYQALAPTLVQAEDEQSFLARTVARAAAGPDAQAHAVRNAIAQLESLQRASSDFNANLVSHRGAFFWIPSTDDLHYLTQRVSTDEVEPELVPSIISSEERSQIAIEEGCKAEYSVQARRHPFAAFTCFFLYVLGGFLLGLIVARQAIAVLHATGVG